MIGALAMPLSGCEWIRAQLDSSRAYSPTAGRTLLCAALGSTGYCPPPPAEGEPSHDSTRPKLFPLATTTIYLTQMTPGTPAAPTATLRLQWYASGDGSGQPLSDTEHSVPWIASRWDGFGVIHAAIPPPARGWQSGLYAVGLFNANQWIGNGNEFFNIGPSAPHP